MTLCTLAFFSFALHHISRVLTCRLVYLPDDGEEDEGEHGEGDGWVYPPVNRCLLCILREPEVHEVVADREGDYGTREEQVDVFL